MQGVIAVDELLAPAYMVADGDDAPEEAEEYVEVENINPAQYYKVRATHLAVTPCSTHFLTP